MSAVNLINNVLIWTVTARTFPFPSSSSPPAHPSSSLSRSRLRQRWNVREREKRAFRSEKRDRCRPSWPRIQQHLEGGQGRKNVQLLASNHRRRGEMAMETKAHLRSTRETKSSCSHRRGKRCRLRGYRRGVSGRRRKDEMEGGDEMGGGKREETDPGLCCPRRRI